MGKSFHPNRILIIQMMWCGYGYYIATYSIDLPFYNIISDANIHSMHISNICCFLWIKYFNWNWLINTQNWSSDWSIGLLLYVNLHKIKQKRIIGNWKPIYLQNEYFSKYFSSVIFILLLQIFKKFANQLNPIKRPEWPIFFLFMQENAVGVSLHFVFKYLFLKKKKKMLLVFIWFFGLRV